MNDGVGRRFRRLINMTQGGVGKKTIYQWNLEGMKNLNSEGRSDTGPSVKTRSEFGKLEEIKSEKRKLTRTYMYIRILISTIFSFNINST